ncbi:MAG: transcriptional regulator [Nitratireductor sp.]
MDQTSDSGEPVLRFLKFRGPQTTGALARHLAVTGPGARKLLNNLLARGLVSFQDEAGAVGRPRRIWRLTEAAQSRFPDMHATLTVEIIQTIRTLFGQVGLDRLIDDRARDTEMRYRAALRAAPDLEARLDRLVALRTKEGYMAAWERAAPGRYLLVENHCPICAAARNCQGFCRSELDIFRRALGPAATVERTEHLLAGARRCAYLVTARDNDARSS